MQIPRRLEMTIDQGTLHIRKHNTFAVVRVGPPPSLLSLSLGH